MTFDPLGDDWGAEPPDAPYCIICFRDGRNPLEHVTKSCGDEGTHLHYVCLNCNYTWTRYL